MTVTDQRSGPNGAIATITIDNPPVNALGAQVRADLTTAFQMLSEPHSDARVVILRGAGGRFCGGGDINELAHRDGPEHDRHLHASFASLYDAVRDCPIPVIAVIDRYAMGGGFELALRCDLRYATPETRLAASGVNMGLVESAHTLTHAISASHAAELLFTGDVVDGARAAAMGLVTRAVASEELYGYVTAVAERIATRPPQAVRKAKSVLRLGMESPAAASAAVSGWLELRASHDHAEALRAFLNHAEPRFEGR